MTIPYVTIEQSCPRWKTARAIITSCIPERLVFREGQHKKDSLDLDCDWAQTLFDLTPEEDKDDIAGRLQVINDQIGDYLPVAEIQTAIDNKLALTPEGIYSVNALLIANDRDREQRHYATAVQMIRHHLGIEQAAGLLGAMPQEGGEA